MQKRTKASARILAGLLLTASPAAAAWAADTSAAAPPARPDPSTAVEPAGVAEVVVTAQRREESIEKVPIAITAVTPRAMATAGVLSTLDLPRVAPGLTVAPTVANAVFVPFLRGVGSNSPATGNDSPIAVYIDGIYQSDKLSNIFDFADVERIEVLKGPQGTLFGRNATGGAINIVTMQPKYEFSGNAEVSYRRFDQVIAKGFVTGPLTDSLAASLALEHIGGGKYLTNDGPYKPGRFGGTTSDSVGFKLRYQRDRLQLTGAVSYLERSTDDMGSNLYPVPGTVPLGVLAGGRADFTLYRYAGSPNRLVTKAWRASVNANYEFDGFDVVSITGYVHARDHNRLDFDGTSADLQYFDEIQGTSDFSQEFQALSTTHGRLHWVAGVYYSHNAAFIDPLNVDTGVPYTTTNADRKFIAPASGFPAGGSVTSIVARGPTRSLAAYGQATYDITDDTHLTVGLRYTSEHREYRFTVSGVGQIAPGFFSPTLIPLVSDDGQRKATFGKPSWRLALDHQLTPGVMIYASYNRGFKSGTFNMNDFAPSQKAVRPEQLDAFEVGMKGNFFDRRLQINASPFYYKYKDLQVDILTGNPVNPTILQNAASENIYGLDLEVIAQPIRDLRLSANASLLHARYGSYKNANAYVQDANGNGAPIAIADAKGMEGLYAPSWSFNLSADYTVHLNNGGDLVFSSTYFRTDGYKTGNGPLDRVIEHDSLGASVTYELPNGRYYVRVFGNNLTDQHVIAYQLLPFKFTRNEIQPISYGVAIGARF